MMFGIGHHLSFVLAITTASLPGAAARPSLRRAQSITKCHIVQTFTQVVKNNRMAEEASWRAVPYEGDYQDQSFVIEMDKSFVEENGAKFGNGNACVKLTSASFGETKGIATVGYTAIEAITCSRSRPSSALRRANRVLVIRAVANDTASAPANKLRDAIFKEGHDMPPSLSSQLRQCSNNASRIEGINATIEGTNKTKVQGGIMNVTIDEKVKDLDRTVMENKMVVAAREILDKVGMKISEFDHVMLCLPKSSTKSRSWKSEGYLNWARSLYYGELCTDVDHLMHEVGLNFGLRRAKDQYSMMGPSVKNAPKMCYDPVNTWDLSWFDKTRTTINLADGPWAGRMTNIVDRVENIPKGKEKHFSVLAKIDMKTGNKLDDLYLGFNKKASFNSDTVNEDELIVAKKEVNGTIKTVRAKGDQFGLREAGVVLRVPNYAGVDRSVFIEVCDMVKESTGVTYYRVVVNVQSENEDDLVQNNYLTCEKGVDEMPVGVTGTALSIQTASGMPGGIPRKFYKAGHDYFEEFKMPNGRMDDCEGMAIEAKLYPDYRETACTQTAAIEICLKTCKKWLPVAAKGKGIERFSNIVDPPPPPAVAKQQADIECVDKDGPAYGNAPFTCAQLGKSDQTQVRILCNSMGKVKENCRYTCRWWNGCQN